MTHLATEVGENELATVLGSLDGCSCVVVNCAAPVAPVVVERVVATEPLTTTPPPQIRGGRTIALLYDKYCGLGLAYQVS